MVFQFKTSKAMDWVAGYGDILRQLAYKAGDSWSSLELACGSLHLTLFLLLTTRTLPRFRQKSQNSGHRPQMSKSEVGVLHIHCKG